MYKAQSSLSLSAADDLLSQDSNGQWDQRQQRREEEEEEVSQMLTNVRALDRQQSQNSRFRQFCCRLEPLVKFLVMYSTAVDMMVQVDVHPSALVWGSLKAVLNVGSARSQQHAAPAQTKIYSDRPEFG